MSDEPGTFHVGGSDPVYYEWRVKGYARWWRVIRRRNGEDNVVGEHLTLEQAYAAMDSDRMLVLSDPLAIEFKAPEIRVT